jgi:LPXTG-motif cell wall-anchored protein
VLPLGGETFEITGPFRGTAAARGATPGSRPPAVAPRPPAGPQPADPATAQLPATGTSPTAVAAGLGLLAAAAATWAARDEDAAGDLG